MKVKLHFDDPFWSIYQYSFGIFAHHFNLSHQVIPPESSASDADITIGPEGAGGDIEVSKDFINNLQNRRWHFKHHFTKESPLIRTSNGRPDYLSTCFYMLNSLQEYADYKRDKYGRFPYEVSYQKHYQCAAEDLVTHYFEKLYEQIFKRKQHKLSAPSPTRLFLTHDIDLIYAARWQEGFHLLKHFQLKQICLLLFRHFKGQPAWLNMEQIMDLEDAYGMKSVFFWLCEYQAGAYRIPNADYKLQSRAIQHLIKKIRQRGFFNGLHKSTRDLTHAQEMAKMTPPPKYNRNHFLLFNLPEHYDHIEKSGLQLDASLGFAEKPGFRNSYGRPFQPYNLKANRPYSFVEVPLHIMDTTFHAYLHTSPEETLDMVNHFIKSHKKNRVLSLLWHNNFFSDYKFKHYQAIYKEILSLAQEESLAPITPPEVIKQYHIFPDKKRQPDKPA